MEEKVWMSVFRERTQDLQGEWNLSIDFSIQPKRPRPRFYEYIKGSFAWFRCLTCKRSWPSKRVQVVFHFSRDAGTSRGTVKMRPYKQKCRRCAAGQMQSPSFEEENIDVMVEKLVEKIRFRCYGENVGDSNRLSQFRGRVNGPHESSHCEACRAGICQQGQ